AAQEGAGEPGVPAAEVVERQEPGARGRLERAARVLARPVRLERVRQREARERDAGRAVAPGEHVAPLPSVLTAEDRPVAAALVEERPLPARGGVDDRRELVPAGRLVK